MFASGGRGKWRRTARPDVPGPNDEREKALSPLLRPPRLTEFTDLRKGQRMGHLGTDRAETPPDSTRHLAQNSMGEGGRTFPQFPGVPPSVSGSRKKGGTATQPTQVGDKRHVGSLYGPIHEGKTFPWGSWHGYVGGHPPAATPSSPKTLGRSFLTGLALP